MVLRKSSAIDFYNTKKVNNLPDQEMFTFEKGLFLNDEQRIDVKPVVWRILLSCFQWEGMAAVNMWRKMFFESKSKKH